MLEFVEQLLEGDFILPDNSTQHYTAQRRVDPITGFSCRITGKRPVDPATSPKGRPDISQQVEATNGCPFCEGNVLKMTPRFPPHIHPDGRFFKGNSILFPNLMPYGRYSAVTIFSTQHHIPLGNFTVGEYEDALGNCLDYARTIQTLDPESVHQAITQNILPSSGGALLHPHIQVNIDQEPMGYHQLLERCEEEKSQGDQSFLLTLASHEERSDRALMTIGEWTFFMAFAPLAAAEVQVVHTSKRTFSQLSTEDLAAFSTGVTAIHRFWSDMGTNAANMVLFSTVGGKHPLFGRLMLRAPYRTWYRTDRSAYEVTAMEAAGDLVPELLAKSFRDSYRPD